MSEIQLSRKSEERGVQRVAIVALVAVIGLVAWQAIVGANPDATTIGLLFGGLIAIVALYYPRGFVSLGNRIANVDAFGIKIELKVKEVQETLEEFAIEEDGAPIKWPDQWPTDDHQAVEMIADLLREKLRFASEAFYGKVPGISEELIIENLGLDGVLTFKEVRLSRDLLDDLYERLDELSEAKRLKFLKSAWAFAFRFATQTFDRKARRDLRKAGWKILDFEQSKGHRPDFRIEQNGVSVLTAARVASPKSTVVVTGERLTKTDAPDDSNLRMIVIPDHTEHLWTEIEDGPMQASGNVLVTRIGKLLDNADLAKTDPSGLKEVSK